MKKTEAGGNFDLLEFHLNYCNSSQIVKSDLQHLLLDEIFTQAT